MKAVVRNTITRNSILGIDRIVVIGIDEDGSAIPHGHSSITWDRDRMPDPRSEKRVGSFLSQSFDVVSFR